MTDSNWGTLDDGARLFLAIAVAYLRKDDPAVDHLLVDIPTRREALVVIAGAAELFCSIVDPDSKGREFAADVLADMLVRNPPEGPR